MRGVVAIPVLIVAALLLAGLDEDAGVRQWLHLRAELSDSHERIEQLRGEVEALRGEAKRLESDEFAIEKAIREELTLARPGESVVRLAPAGITSSRIP